jgi:NADPH2:quinone reductase
VGFYAVQIAKIAGARVIATVSREEQAQRARQAGADHVVNYRSEDVTQRVREITGAEWGVDRAVDVAFGANLAVNMTVMRAGGVIATYASDAVPDPAIPFWPMLARDLTVRFVLVYAMPRAAHDEAAAFVTEALAGGRFVPQVFGRFPIERTAEAHEATESMSNVGKVLVNVA